MLENALRRGWPYLVGLMLCTFFAFAEAQTWTPTSSLTYSAGLVDWFTTRVPSPVQYAMASPAGWWAVAILVPLIAWHALRPRWWNAPLAFGGMTAWCIWGSMALGAG